jgi:CHAT domain-containing protein
MLVYFLTLRSCHLFLVPPGDGEIRCLALTWPEGGPVAGEELNRELELLLSSLARPGRSRGLGIGGAADRGDREARQRSHRLFRALIPAAVREEILGVERLVVVPHGALHRLPFEALVAEPGEDPATTRYWIDLAPPIVYAPSATVSRWSRSRSVDAPAPGTVREVVALGDPVFTLAEPPESPDRERREQERSLLRERFGGLSPLPGTRREVERMREALEEADGFRVHALLGEDARESRLHDLAPRARILHLATHHLADETETASASCLALTLPERPTREDDGFLNLGELLLKWRDRIRGCELVVLSACETQRGRMQMDEAVFAMPVGFLYAGASSVIASLWRVDDDSTAELMATFYRKLVKDRDGSNLTAFHQARRALKKTRPHPYHWAPFVYLGDPR